MEQPPLNPQQLTRALKPRSALKKRNVRIKFESPIHPPRAGVRVFPAPVKGTLIKRPARSRGPAASTEIDENKLGGFLPDHLALNPHTPDLDKQLKRGKFFDPMRKLKKGEYMATTIFPPDQRRVFFGHIVSVVHCGAG